MCVFFLGGGGVQILQTRTLYLETFEELRITEMIDRLKHRILTTIQIPHNYLYMYMYVVCTLKAN